MIEIQNLGYQVPNGPALHYRDFHLPAGEALLILGPSGSGKTTLLHLMAGILLPTQGSVCINGIAINQLNTRQRDRFLGQHIGLVYQRTHFIESLSVQQNIQAASYFAHKPYDTAFAQTITQNLGIRQLLHKKTYSISVGEAQRVSIARALINKPALLLADEPTSALDDENCIHVVELLKAQTALVGSALIIVTHDQRLKAHFDRHYHLS
jgi:putative ABC transport system ATP-binding protein